MFMNLHLPPSTHTYFTISNNVLHPFMLHCVCRLEKDYDKIKLLGKGAFGVVYHVKHEVDCKEYAVKIIKL